MAYQFIFLFLSPINIYNNPHKAIRLWKSNYQFVRRIRKASRTTNRCFRLCGTLTGTHQPFADATLDHQWIHVDTERAKVDSPYHSTIAHGYLTLSMLPYLWNQIIQVNNLK